VPFHNPRTAPQSLLPLSQPRDNHPLHFLPCCRLTETADLKTTPYSPSQLFPSIGLPPQPSHRSPTNRLATTSPSPSAASVSPFNLSCSNQNRCHLQLPPPPLKPCSNSSPTHGCTHSSGLQHSFLSRKVCHLKKERT
jgi:hypothetical protein